MSNHKKGKDTALNAFTVDQDTGSMPSITKLLDRKKLENSKTSAHQPAPPPAFPKAPPVPPPGPINKAPPISQPPAAPAAEPAALPQAPEPDIAVSSDSGFELEKRNDALPGESSGPPTGGPAPKKAERRAKVPELAKWQLQTLKSGADPLGKGLALLMSKGARSALYLAAIAPPVGSPVPHFVATATVAPDNKLEIWTGCKWDPVLTPDTWNKFVQTGFVELSPPGTTTNMKSNRNIIRAAFGITQEEWLLLVRVGTAQSYRGVVAIVSTKSLLPELPGALPLFSAVFSAPAKKAA